MERGRSGEGGREGEKKEALLFKTKLDKEKFQKTAE